jgi:hypothetical protein
MWVFTMDWLFADVQGEERCRSERPALHEVAPGRHAACHFPRLGQPTS